VALKYAGTGTRKTEIDADTQKTIAGESSNLLSIHRLLQHIENAPPNFCSQSRGIVSKPRDQNPAQIVGD